MRQKIASEIENGKLKIETGTGKSEHWNPVLTLLSWLLTGAFVAACCTLPAVRWIVLFCLLCYPMAVLPTHLTIKKVIADPQFRSSVNFGVRFFFSLLYTLVIAIVAAATGGLWMSRLADLGTWWGLIAIAVVFLAARLTGPIYNFFRNTLTGTRHWFRH